MVDCCTVKLAPYSNSFARAKLKMQTLLSDGFEITITTNMGTMTYSVLILGIRGLQNAFYEELHNVIVLAYVVIGNLYFVH